MYDFAQTSGTQKALELSKLLKKKPGTYTAEIVQVLEAKELFAVMNHGDCWNNNMMFQGSNLKNHEKMIFVDLQV